MGPCYILTLDLLFKKKKIIKNKDFFMIFIDMLYYLK